MPIVTFANTTRGLELAFDGGDAHQHDADETDQRCAPFAARQIAWSQCPSVVAAGIS